MIGGMGLTFRSSPDGLLRVVKDQGLPRDVVVQMAGLHKELHEADDVQGSKETILSPRFGDCQWAARFRRGALVCMVACRSLS